MYADDTQLYLSFSVNDSAQAMEKLQKCIADIRKWMRDNHLKLNDTKTEFLVIGNTSLTKQLHDASSITLGDANISAVNHARNIGVIIDSHLDLVQHVSSVCRTCYLYIHNISKIRCYLNEDAAAKIVNALVTSRLDYANAILYGIPDYLLHRLQLVQNSAARLVLRRRRHDHVMPLLEKLHWLPISLRIKFKINLLTFKCIHSLAPKYLMELLSSYIPPRNLRSASQNLLIEKKGLSKKTGDRSFSVAAPKLWNSLPSNIREIDELSSFRRSLKTHYFRKAFYENCE